MIDGDVVVSEASVDSAGERDDSGEATDAALLPSQVSDDDGIPPVDSELPPTDATAARAGDDVMYV